MAFDNSPAITYNCNPSGKVLSKLKRPRRKTLPSNRHWRMPVAGNDMNNIAPVIPGMRALTKDELGARILTPSQLKEKIREFRREGLKLGKERQKILEAREKSFG